MTDWSGHIDALIGAGILIFVQVFINFYFLGKIKRIHNRLYRIGKWYGQA